MKNFILVIATLLTVVVTTPAQTPDILSEAATVQSSSPAAASGERTRPRLRRAVRPAYDDQLAVADGEYIYLRSGSGIELPLTDGAPMVLRLDSPVSTSGMKGVPMFRNIPLRSPILTRFAQVIAPKDILVETRILGEASGFKNRAEITIEPETIMVDIDSYVLIGERDGQRVFLKPGKWAIKLRCNILSVENPDGRSWYAKSDQESGMKGGRFGLPSKSANAEEHFSGLIYLNPYGPLAYGFSQIKGLLTAIFKRPNIKLPERTEIHYRIERMEATYLSQPIPKGPAKIVDQ